MVNGTDGDKTVDKTLFSGFAGLTWFDLESHFSSKVLSRGKSLAASGAAGNLTLIGGNTLIADVQGTMPYVTKVQLDKGLLSTACTCPYGISCKHAAAVLLQYLNAVKANRTVSTGDLNDTRIAKIDNFYPGDESEVEEGWPDKQKLPNTPAEDAVADNKIFAQLRTKTKEELIDILGRAIKRYPEFRNELGFQARLRDASAPDLVKKIKREIAKTCKEPGWWDGWNHRGYIPDFSKVTIGLQKLLDAGQADEVVKVGEFLWTQGNELIGQSNDEGETQTEAASAMAVVIQALSLCSMPILEKMERAVNLELEDQFGLCDGMAEFWKREYSKEQWGQLVDRLKKRLADMKPVRRDEDWIAFRLRDHLLDILVRTLDFAGLSGEMFSLCEEEAKKTGDYRRLTDCLLKHRRLDEAEDWARKGIAISKNSHDGMDETKVLEIRTLKKDWTFIAAYHVENFFAGPSFRALVQAEEALRKVKLWVKLKPLILVFLETGIIPAKDKEWPLPATQLQLRGSRICEKPPYAEILLEYALHENNIESSLKWFEVYSRQEKFHFSESLADKTAILIADAHPKKSLEIWKSIAEHYVAQTGVPAYMQAATYLRKMQKIMLQQNRRSEWDKHLAQIIEQNKRKKRLLEILDGLSDRPIVEG